MGSNGTSMTKSCAIGYKAARLSIAENSHKKHLRIDRFIAAEELGGCRLK